MTQAMKNENVKISTYFSKSSCPLRFFPSMSSIYHNRLFINSLEEMDYELFQSVWLTSTHHKKTTKDNRLRYEHDHLFFILVKHFKHMEKVAANQFEWQFTRSEGKVDGFRASRTSQPIHWTAMTHSDSKNQWASAMWIQEPRKRSQHQSWKRDRNHDRSRDKYTGRY